jgi:hypothetical protein
MMAALAAFPNVESEKWLIFCGNRALALDPKAANDGSHQRKETR